VVSNGIEGHVDGLETWGSYRVSESWRLHAGHGRMSRKLGLKPGSRDAGGIVALGNDPEHWTTLRSSHDIGASQELDVMARHVGQRPNGPVPAYTAVDLRWALWLRRDVELSVTGHNLFDRRHPEWGGAPANRAEIERGAYFRVAFYK
jgi:iron complex outermembrane receptor protein